MNDSINITGHTSHINAIANIGKDPDRWLTALEELEALNNGPHKQKLLQHFFAQAGKQLNPAELRRNRSYAILLGKQALFRGETDASEARNAFQAGLVICNEVPTLYVTFAQFELDQGRKDKALKILNHAGACRVKGDIIAAKKKLEQGFTNICSTGMTKNRSPLKNVTNGFVTKTQGLSLSATKDLYQSKLCNQQSSTAFSSLVSENQCSERNVRGLSSAHQPRVGNDFPCTPPQLNASDTVSWQLDIKSPVPPPGLDSLIFARTPLSSSNLTFHSGTNHAKCELPESFDHRNHTTLPCMSHSSQSKKKQPVASVSRACSATDKKTSHVNVPSGPRRVLVSRVNPSNSDSDSGDEIQPDRTPPNAGTKDLKPSTTTNDAVPPLPSSNFSSSAFKPYSKTEIISSQTALMKSFQPPETPIISKQHHQTPVDVIQRLPAKQTLPTIRMENGPFYARPERNLSHKVSPQIYPNCDPSVAGLTANDASNGHGEIPRQVNLSVKSSQPLEHRQQYRNSSDSGTVSQNVGVLNDNPLRHHPTNRCLPASSRDTQSQNVVNGSLAPLGVHPAFSSLPETKVVEMNGVAYIILKLLGKGGSSKVYQALNTATSEIVAVKQVKIVGCESSVLDGYKNEIKFLEKLQGSRHIIRLIDYDIRERHLYIIMESGSLDLSAYLKKQKSLEVPLDIIKTLMFWKDMLLAVAAIHKHNVIHLDLKPANFMIVDLDLKLIDFGIANSIQVDATSVIKDTQFGTLNYMAPETINDMSGGNQSGWSDAPQFKVGPKADVWSLGCILYFMMYGKTPFQHITHQILKLRAITNENHRIAFPNFPNAKLVEIVQACLNRDPKRRPTVEMLLNHPLLK